ncbi:MAG: hypothetical protein KatS3mg028_0491 [Bacteroidia bacterium]|nr:MAG: hypothetical protein KatS3mg028_0491 [Bacteroidia bacterium]
MKENTLKNKYLKIKLLYFYLNFLVTISHLIRYILNGNQ